MPTEPSKPDLSVADVVEGWVLTDTLAALDALEEVSGHVTRLVARRGGMSANELHTIRHLVRGPISPGALAEELGVSTAASSQIIDRLAERGHAQRIPHPTDKRRTQVAITEQGRQESLPMLAPMFRALAELDRGLQPEERVIIERFLRGAADAIRRLV